MCHSQKKLEIKTLQHIDFNKNRSGDPVFHPGACRDLEIVFHLSWLYYALDIVPRPCTNDKGAPATGIRATAPAVQVELRMLPDTALLTEQWHFRGDSDGIL